MPSTLPHVVAGHVLTRPQKVRTLEVSNDRITKHEMNPPPNRRWLRFSLCTMLIVLAVLCVLAARISHKAIVQRQVVAWVHKTGGSVEYDYERYDENGCLIWPWNAELPAPKWLIEVVGVDFFASVVHVHLGNTHVADLSALTKLPNLKTLSMEDHPIPLFSSLAKLPQFEELSIERVDIAEEDLTKIERALPKCRIGVDSDAYYLRIQLERIEAEALRKFKEQFVVSR